MKADAQLLQDVIAELRREPSIDAAQIGADIADGVVTLSGHARSHIERCEAERAARRVLGVRAVAIKIKTTLSVSDDGHDAAIARAAHNVSQWMSYLPKDCVDTMIRHGWDRTVG
jgi:hypothetical protein